MSIFKTALDLQAKAYNAGHDNSGASIDVQAEVLAVLSGFKHLNPAQAVLREALQINDTLKYAYPLCSAARKAVRHYVVTLK